jgi:hypothetical protein
MIHFARLQLALLSARISLLAAIMRGTDRTLCGIVWLSERVLTAAGRAHRAVLADVTTAYINALTTRNTLRDHLNTPDPDAPSGCLGDECIGMLLIIGAPAVVVVTLLEASNTSAATLIAWVAR